MKKIERVQTGVRLEKKILKVLKGIAEYRDLTLGELLEVIVLHSFENKPPFTPDTLKAISQLKKVYSMDYSRHDYEKFLEKG